MATFTIYVYLELCKQKRRAKVETVVVEYKFFFLLVNV